MSEIMVHFVPGMGRQGDVLIVPASVPFSEGDLGKLVQDSDGSRVVLAYGEVTGHAHAFYPQLDEREEAANDADARPRAALYELSNPGRYCATTLTDGVRALRLTARCLLRHEEHAFQSFPAGDYVVIQQQVGDEIKEMRRVAD